MIKRKSSFSTREEIKRPTVYSIEKIAIKKNLRILKRHKSRFNLSMKSKRFSPRVIEAQGIKVYAAPCSAKNQYVEPFISQFCKINEWYVKVDREWAVDWFNTVLLDDMVPNFDLALEAIGDEHSDAWKYLDDSKIQNIILQASHLYGLIHARWICQNKGLNLMKQKYEKGIYGTCPRALCKNTPLIPMGTTLKPRRHTVKLFCPRCCDIYVAPKDVIIDGCHFGPAFPHIFLSEYDKFDLRKKFKPFIQRAFGFDIYRSCNARYLPHKTNKHENEFPRRDDQ
ncbi:Casein kinase II regulatory subunit family protein [Tritrichomonas foetus]|uniref:Casein kinase II subunit beta n=1 Tax=Tritrichomonas foetus TaxID=1144522 RepID=A0A1J4JCD4_9EUKA|nr:Casein kinase II regulatory subunit family protein [Tritrichomonas foetus]|eukprot:OHS95307.1 Casein kinase II regulatory subunit family protein [Tritrichomonas foetus]